MASSLRRQLPLWIAAVLTATVVVIASTGYFELHRSISSSVSTRFDAAGAEIGTLLQPAFARGRAGARDMAASPALVSFVATETPQSREAAVAALKARPQTPRFASMAVWSFDGKLLASDGEEKTAAAVRPALFPSIADSGSVGRFVRTDSGFAYGIAAPIRIRGRQVALVIGAVHSSAAPNNNAPLIARLVGKDATVLIGNAGGDVWTDLSRVVRPPLPGASPKLVEFRDSSNAALVGKSTLIAGSPWATWIQMPEESSSIAAVHAFRTRSLVLALVIGIIGALVSWMVVHRVTERSDATELAERAELLEQKNELLRNSELRFRQLVDHSPEGIIVHRATRIIFANPVAARLFGADDPDQIVGRSVLEFLHPDERMGGVDVLGMSAKPGEPTPLVDIRLARKENEQTVVEATSMGVTFDGQPAVQTIMRDITEKQVLEEQFRQAQKMEAVGKLAGGIAHDFNNLLTIIHTYTELTLNATPESDPRHADLSEVMHATTSAARLTRQMLAFSRKQVLALARIDLNEATGGVIAMIKRIIGDNIEVSTKLRDGVAPIWADVGQLEQVLLNLSVNARDAMPNGGLLTIETSNVRLESGYSSHHGQPIPAGEYVLLTVADTGSGMTEDVQRQIFDPFFTTKEQGKGTGLGLSTVYGIVKQSEGHIWVYSEPGQGTVFKVYLPRYVGTEGDIAAPSLDPVPMLDRPTHVLLVEDEPHVRAAVRRVLESRKIRVTEADRPSTAAAMFSDGTDDIDLVLTDMMMPEKNGAELVRELTVRKPDLRAIIMSGYSEEATSRQWRLPPNALFIEKPIAPADLFRKLHDALGWVA